MRRPTFRLAAVAFLFLLAAGTTAARAQTLRAGVAVEDLDVAPGTPLAGYSDRLGLPSEGTHDPVTARALVLDDGEDRVAILAIDAIGVTDEIKSAVLAALPRELGLSERNVLVAATHTHSGPGALSDGLLETIACGAFDPDQFERTSAAMARALALAASRLAPARLAWATRELDGLNRNRRTPGGPVDRDLGVLRVDDEGGRPLALLATFACHPTVLSGKNRLLSSDFVGPLRAALEERFPGATALFLNGPEGDQGPAPPSGENGFEKCESLGRAIAAAAGDMAAGLATVGRADVASELRRIELPPSTAAAFVPKTAPVQTLAIGGARLLAFPGEPVAAMGRRMEALSRERRGGLAFAIGCANEHLYYLPDRETYRRGAYESLLSFYGPGIEDALRSGFFPELPLPPPPSVEGSWLESRDGLAVLHVRGTPQEMGYQHGWLLRERIRAVAADFEAEIAKEVMPVVLAAAAPLAAVAPGLLARGRDLLLPALAVRARSLHAHVSDEFLAEVEALAAGAGMPYDTVFLMNVFLTLAEQEDKAKFLLSAFGPHCTNLVALPGATKAGETLHLRNLDWAMQGLLAKSGLVTFARPASGRGFASVSWIGLAGTLTAMNDAGLSIAEESVAAKGDTDFDGEPIMPLLRDAIQRSTTLAEAVERVRSAKGTCGYHVSIASGREGDGRVVEVTGTRSATRKPDGALLPGCSRDVRPELFEEGKPPAPEIPRDDASSRVRYARVAELAAASHGAIDVEAGIAMLRDRAGKICNDGTVQSVVMVPGRGEIHVAQGSVPAPSGNYVRFSLAEELARTKPPAAAPPGRPGAALLAEESGDYVARREPLTDPSEPGKLFDIERVTMPSPVAAPYPELNTIDVTVFSPRRPNGAAVVIIPIWKGPEDGLERVIARQLAGNGFLAAIVPLPGQWKRRPKGFSNGDYTVSADVARTRDAMLQGMADVRRVAHWLRRDRGIAEGRLGVLGVSLGGFVSATALSVLDEFSAAVVALAGGGIADVLLGDSRETRRVRDEILKRGISREELARLCAEFDPVTFADPARRDRVLMFNAEADEIVPAESGRKLWAAYGSPEIIWVPAGHYTAIFYLPQLLERATAHFTRLLLAR